MAEAARVGDPMKLPAAVRTVLLVHAAQGIIDNGELQYFFENDFPNQPPYAIFVDAYRAIGAIVEADALTAAIGLFPFAEPQKNWKLREAFLEQFQDGGAHGPDSPFAPLDDQLCGNKAVWRLLAEYVATHANAFLCHRKW